MAGTDAARGARRIRLVVFDWAGTTIDHGCLAPVAAFVETFRRHGVEITARQARIPMGLHKRDHIRALAELPEVARQWQAVHGRPCGPADVDEMFQEHFVPLQMEVVSQHCALVPGLLEAVDQLRQRGIFIGSTTGYFQEAAERVVEAAGRQGYRPDWTVSASQVPEGRPAPWMVYRNMEAAGVYPACCVVKIGDTPPDIAEARNASCWSVGVTQTSSEVGLAEDEFSALDGDEQQRLLAHAEQVLRSAGAHDVIRSVADAPALIDLINERLQKGEMPESA